MDTPVLTDKQNLTFISSVKTLDLILENLLIVAASEKSKVSILLAGLDGDDDIRVVMMYHHFIINFKHIESFTLVVKD